MRRLLCCGCGWCLLRLFLKKIRKNWLFGCCGDDRDDQARPRCCAATHLAGPSPPPPPPPPLLLLLRLRLRLRCCYCAAAAAAAAVLLFDGVVLGPPLSVRLGATAPCLSSKFDLPPRSPPVIWKPCTPFLRFVHRQNNQEHAGVNLAFF